MEPVRLVVVFYLVSAMVLGVFLAEVLADLAARFQLGGGNELLAGVSFSRPPQLIGFTIAFGAAIYAWVNPKVRTASTEVANELMRVTWPTLEETRLHTVAVVVASLVAAVVLFGIDRLAYQLMLYWLPDIWGKL